MKNTEKVIVSVEKLVLPTYAEPAPEELPMFAENRVHQRTSGDPYPNKIVARVDREHREDKEYTAVRLENEYVSVVILPEIGGRIYSATDKTTGYDFFYKQHVIKPALIGVLGSWISGGVEFNWPFHHRASGYMACDFSVEEFTDGSAICHLSEHDPIDRMKGMVSIVLRPGEKFFETRMRLYNRTSMPHSFLWWENAAVPVNESYQIFFPEDVTYVNFHYLKSRTTYPVAGNGVFNGIPMKEPRDISYHKNTREATSYFASASDYDFFGGYDHGKGCGVVHIGDHHLSPGKKMFTWAYGQLSRSWERALTDTDGQYAELMAGSYSDNQPDFSWLAPYETKEFSQYWYPISEIGTPTFANLNCAFKIARGERNTLRIQPCRAYENATVCVLDGETELYRSIQTLMPNTCTVLDVGTIPRYVTVVLLDANGAEIASYAERQYDAYGMPEVITDMPSAKTLANADELYRAGVHVDQYRDPATKPDAYWQEGLARDPNHVPTLIAMARYECANRRLDTAKDYAERALRILCTHNNHPESGEAYYVYGQILEARGEYKAAHDAYYKASFAADCVSRAMTRVAVLDIRNKQYAEALRHARWALDYGRNNSLAVATLAIALIETGAGDQAKSVLEEQLLRDPLDHMARFLADVPDFYGVMQSDPAQTCLDLCADLFDMGRWHDAARLLNRLAEARPDSAVKLVWYTLAFLAAQTGENGDAYLKNAKNAPLGRAYPSRPIEARALEHAIAHTDDADAKMLLGCILYHGRNYEAAVALWENCTDSYVSKRNLAVAYFSHLGRADEALKLMREVLSERPEDESLLYETVVLMNKMNCDPEEKISLILSHRVTRDDIKTELAKAYNQARRPDDALSTLMSHAFTPCEGGEHAIADQYMLAYLQKGTAAYEKGDYEAALRFFTEGQTLPQSLGAGVWNHTKLIPLRYREALCLARLGRVDEARGIWTYIAEVELEYFSNMYLPELPYYQALSWEQLGEYLKSRAIVTEYTRKWGAIRDMKDTGFFATTPFFMPFIDQPGDLRRSRYLYLTGLLDLCRGEDSAAREKLRESYALNNDNVMALLYI